MSHNSILCTSSSRQRDAYVRDRRVPAQLRHPFYAMQLCSLRENLAPCYPYRTKLSFAQEPAPAPGTWPSTN